MTPPQRLMTGTEENEDGPRKEYKVRRSTRSIAYDGLKEDVLEEDTSEASDDNSNCSLFRSDDEEDNIE